MACTIVTSRLRLRKFFHSLIFGPLFSIGPPPPSFIFLPFLFLLSLLSPPTMACCTRRPVFLMHMMYARFAWTRYNCANG